MNLDLSSLTSRITIASCLSVLIVATLCGQDLEEVNIRSRPQSRTIEVDQTLDADSISVRLSQSSTTVAAPVHDQINQRDPDTYRKQAYIHTMLRHTYYHRLTTSPWSRYLNSKGWDKNVRKWRYWSHLKSYLTSSDQNIIILREHEEKAPMKTEPAIIAVKTTPSELKKESASIVLDEVASDTVIKVAVQEESRDCLLYTSDAADE